MKHIKTKIQALEAELKAIDYFNKIQRHKLSKNDKTRKIELRAKIIVLNEILMNPEK